MMEIGDRAARPISAAASRSMSRSGEPPSYYGRSCPGAPNVALRSQPSLADQPFAGGSSVGGAKNTSGQGLRSMASTSFAYFGHLAPLPPWE